MLILRGTVNVRKRGVSLVTLEGKKNTCHCRNDSRNPSTYRKAP